VRSWPPGRLAVQLVLIVFLFLACFGALGTDGIAGLAVVLGVVLILYAIVRALR
jgi:hypothetical protein